MPRRLVLISLCLSLTFIIYSCGKKPKKPAPAPPRPTVAEKKARKAPSPPEKQAAIVVIIDDMGNNLAELDEVLALPAPVAVAVLPMLRYSGETAKKAESAGRVVLLHMPMQPKGGPDAGQPAKGLGPGALMSGMGPEDIKRILAEDLASVPGAEGVNNHMGSLLTEDKTAMGALMVELKSRKLFFIDSRTTAGSVACRMAMKDGVLSASREVFLDDSPAEADIKAQFERLVNIAKKEGIAVGIGHPRPTTIKVLDAELRELSKQGVRMAEVSEALKK